MSGNDCYQLPAGTVLEGRYRVGEILGEGGFGITYLGRDLKLDIPVAIKEYYPFGVAVRQNTSSLDISVSRSDSAEMFRKGKESFLTEARNLGKFANEDSVVYVRDHFEANNTAYIIMEYLDGQSLKDYVEANGPMTFEQAFALLEPIMTVLDKIHKAGMIHRDISPSNMFILKNGKVKLLDFGTARDINADGEKSLSVVLKPGYAPVEQYRSHGTQGPWSDVYALCASIYKIITGVTPENAVNRITGDSLKPPSELGAKISPEEEKVLMAGMAVNAADRIKSMGELKAAFEGKTAEEPDENDPELTVGRFNTPVPPVGSQKPYSRKPGEQRNASGTGSREYYRNSVSYGGFCTSCGAPLPKGAAFCPVCSAPVSGQPKYGTGSGSGNEKTVKPVTLIIIAAVAVLAVLLGIFLYKKLTDDDPKPVETSEETSDDTTKETSGDADEEGPDVTLIPTQTAEEVYAEEAQEGAAPEESSEDMQQAASQGSGLPASADMRTPFYGVWCRSTHDLTEAQEMSNTLSQMGYDAYTFSSDNWSNMDNGWYIVTAGRFASEEDAQFTLESVRANVIGEAYVKYTGEYTVAGTTPTPTAAPTPTPTPTLIYEEPSETVPDTSDYITVIGGIQAPRSNFMFPDSSTRLLTEDEINSLYRDDQVQMHDISQLAINEIYARYGYTFTRKDSTSAQLARDTFEGRDWYVQAQQLCPTNDPDVLKHSYMNSIEQANIDNIGKWQQLHVIYY